jgi:hypothetical protein
MMPAITLIAGNTPLSTSADTVLKPCERSSWKATRGPAMSKTAIMATERSRLESTWHSL